MKQRELEIMLQRLEGFRDPKPNLEQYATPAKIAADILYTAHGLGDVEGARVVDLGCGTGTFAIGACLLGASSVTGLDIDEGTLETARANADKAGCEVSFEHCGVEEASGSFETCIMNPPFGSQSRHADLPFLDKAMELAAVTYSLHNSGTVDYLRRRIMRSGCAVSMEKSYKFEIRHTFDFHRKERADFDVTLLRIVRP